MVVLPAPVEPTKADLLAGQAVQVDVVEDGLFGGVAEVHVKEADVALQLGVGQGAVVVGVVSRPK